MMSRVVSVVCLVTVRQMQAAAIRSAKKKETADNPEAFESSSETTVEQKDNYETWLHGVAIFIRNWKQAIKKGTLQSMGLVDGTAASFANFLHKLPELTDDPRVGKVSIGDILGHHEGGELGKFCVDVRTAYFEGLGFANQPLVHSLRCLVSRASWPGESANIERVIEAFSQSYFLSLKHHNVTANRAFRVAMGIRADFTIFNTGSKKDTKCLLRKFSKDVLQLIDAFLGEHPTEKEKLLCCPRLLPREFIGLRENPNIQMKPEQTPPSKFSYIESVDGDYIVVEQCEQVFTLTWSIIMLDSHFHGFHGYIHRKNQRRNETVDDYIERNRGICGESKSFPDWYMTELFDSLHEVSLSGEARVWPPTTLRGKAGKMFSKIFK